MKKSYLTLAAMAMIMASCSNEVLIDNEDGQTDVAIGFSTFSDKATKADPQKEDLEKYHPTMSIYGTKQSVNDQSVSRVFDAVVATYSSDAKASPNEWTYSPLRYWDNQASYAFAAVAPSNKIIDFKLATDETMVADLITDGTDFVGTTTLLGTNLQAVATASEKKVGFYGPDYSVDAKKTDDTDIMTSNVVKRAVKNHDLVDFTFKHILAKLNVTVAKSSVLNNAVVRVESIEISGLDDKGTYAESKYNKATTYKQATEFNASTTYYTDQIGTKAADGEVTTENYSTYYVVDKPVTSGWTSTVADASYKLKYAQASKASTDNVLADTDDDDKVVPSYFIESLVMPQSVNAEVLTMIYTITTGEGDDAYTEKFKYVMNLKDAFTNFMDRNNYTIKFTIDPDVIEFDASAYEWIDSNIKEITIE